MDSLEFIMCHGSANRFVMIDAVAKEFDFEGVDSFVRDICAKTHSDGVLFLVKYNTSDMAMRMFNTDGSESEMCGNGMRCIARLADEKYLKTDSYTLFSGGQSYPITRKEPLGDGVATYGVEISISTATKDFTLSDTMFLGQPIEELDDTLLFTYLNLGNPHIVAQVDEINLDQLSTMGERVKSLKNIFPYGVNVSVMKHLGGQEIFVATYERGVGLTASCGTAMTASSTTATLLNLTQADSIIDVCNRGGFVRCICHNDLSGIKTELIGNATYEYLARYTSQGEVEIIEEYAQEQQSWNAIVASSNI
ncbi:MAG: diaminopimelate epimerase [Rikenellaceae bacterium]